VTHPNLEVPYMLYVVLFTDDPQHAAVRPRKMPEHLAFLEANRHCILAAGPLRDPTDGSATAGLWLVDAPDAEAVAALYRADPFWPTGLRRAVQVWEWSRVFADGQRLI
jgi:uncharacterized protein YciI